jgi:hypothetical protein
MNTNVDIPANGASVKVNLGVFKYLRVSSAPVGFQISFNGSLWSNSRQNAAWDFSGQNPPPESFFVRCLNALATSIVLDYDTKPLSAQDTSVLNAQTFVLCNSGAAGLGNYPKAKQKVTGADWVFNAANAVDVTASGAIKIPGNYNGCRRKTITFVWTGQNASPAVVITDKNGFIFLILGQQAAFQQFSFDVSDDFYVCGVLGAVVPNNCFYYNEIYYSNAN